MKPYTIEFVHLKSVHQVIELRDAFEVRKDRPCVWLQRLCVWVLRKLRAYAQKDTVEIQRAVIDADTFMGRLFKQRRSLVEAFNSEPDRLLIGCEDYAELMNSHEIMTRAFSFGARYGHGQRMLGLKVQVIPWMRGILVMPKVSA